MVSPTTKSILFPTAVCILWLCDPTTLRFRPPPLVSLLAVHPLLHTTSNTPVGSALARSASVPFHPARPCSLGLLVHFVLALPFEGSTAFILAPSLAIHHLSSWLQPPPSTPIGHAPPVPPPRPLLLRLSGLFLAFVFASSALAPPLEGRVQAHTTPYWLAVAMIFSSSPLRHRRVAPHWLFTVSIFATRRLRSQGISCFSGRSVRSPLPPSPAVIPSSPPHTCCSRSHFPIGCPTSTFSTSDPAPPPLRPPH